jgi:hypothetical protein
VIECDPAVKVETLSDALLAPTVPDPRVVLPSINVTVPLEPLGESAAINLTEPLYVDGFTEDVRVMVVLA